MVHSNFFRRIVVRLCLLSILGIVGLTLLAQFAPIGALPAFLEVGGNLHPVFLHLPIGAFIYLGFAEAWNLTGAALFKRGRIRGVFPVLVFGVVSSLMAAVAGLLLYMQGEYNGGLVEQHLVWGVGFAISAHVVLIFYLLFEAHSFIYRVVLLASFVGVMITGHWGGMITHGDPLEPLTRAEEKTDKPVEEVLFYEVVAQILESKCYQCHSEGKKQKGGLLMDSYEALLAGGDEGPALVPGDLEASLMSNYIHLPLDDEHHMPPEGKPQLIAREIELIDAWIAAGALRDVRLLESDLPAPLGAWAVDYMSAPKEKVLVVEDLPEEADEKVAELDLDEMLQSIGLLEQRAEKSITRLGPDGDLLSFTAVNARDSMGPETVDSLLPLMPRVVDLDLSGTNIRSEDLARLMENAGRLARLNLGYTDVDTSWLEAAGALPNLESLVLTGNPLTIADAAAIARHGQLKRLYVVQTGLSPDAVALLREILPECEIVGADSIGL